jgi:hypothetical protein
VKRILSIMLLALFVAGCGEVQAKTQQKPQQTVTVTTAATAASPAPTTESEVNAPAPTTEDTDTSPSPTEEVAFGGHVTDGHFRFKVTAATHVASIPVEYDNPIRPQHGTKLIRVDLLVTNEGNIPRDDPFCGGGDAVLIDHAGRNFAFNDDQTLDLGQGYCGDSLQPLLPGKVTLVFDVPKAAGKVTGIALWDDSDGDNYDGSRYAVIDL